ncbi:MAG TPA: hypothetical protein VEC75_03995 [Stellaceae bacterium]|nr:hypothetical protein [Stellaceae bacterium]
MVMRELELGDRKHRPTPIRGRDLAAAWLTAAVVVVTLLMLGGARHSDSDPALAAVTIQRDCQMPDGIGETHPGVITCTTRDWADEVC